MALFFVVEDDNSQRAQWCNWLQLEGHLTVDAFDVLSGIETFRDLDDDPDLIILDHNLGDGYGIDIIDYLVGEYGFCDQYFYNRIILITGSHDTSLGKEYSKRGSIGNLVKPVSKTQFWMTINGALEHRKLVDQSEDWEAALSVLENQGLLKPLEELQSVQDNYNILKETHEQLLDDIKQAGSNKQNVSVAYERDYQSLTSLGDDIGNIPSLLQSFSYSDKFIEDIKELYRRDKLYFFVFQSYLSRISIDPFASRTRNIQGKASSFFEYRIGREYRLYFSYSESTIKFHRLTRKSKQEETISYLSLL